MHLDMNSYRCVGFAPIRNGGKKWSLLNLCRVLTVDGRCCNEEMITFLRRMRKCRVCGCRSSLHHKAGAGPAPDAEPTFPRHLSSRGTRPVHLDFL